MGATLALEIPGDVLESTRMTMADLKLELAISLFVGERLSMGKAAELAGLPISVFQMHFGPRHLVPPYAVAEAHQDRDTLAALRPQ